MFCRRTRCDGKRGVSVLEYAVLVIALVGALIVVSSYLRRAISSKWRDAADTFGGGRQYNPSGPKATQVQNLAF